MASDATQDFADATEEFGRNWNRFWFAPTDARKLCALRIVVGLLAAAHLIDAGNGLNVWYASDGLLPPASANADFHFSYLNFLPASSGLWLMHVLGVAVALAFAAGLLTRISGVLTLVNLLAYVHRVPQVAGHAEPVLCFLTAYLCLAPAGLSLSLDRRLFGFKPSGWTMLIGSCDAPVAANVALRLIQVHLAMFYAMMGLTKLYGDAWWEGNAVWLLLAQTQSRPLDLTGIRRWGQLGEYVLNFWTHAIVYFELAFGVLIWTRIGRPILLWLSVAIWLSIIVATGQLLFGLTMLAANIAFLPAGAPGPSGSRSLAAARPLAA